MLCACHRGSHLILLGGGLAAWGMLLALHVPPSFRHN